MRNDAAAVQLISRAGESETDRPSLGLVLPMQISI
jgi:hypothetical protein